MSQLAPRPTSLAVSAGLAAALALAGCGTKHSSALPPTTTATTAATTSTADAATSTSAAAPSTSEAPATTSSASTAAVSSTSRPSTPVTTESCNLAVSAGSPDGAAGTIGVELRFTNRGAPCVLGGFPGVALLSPSGAQAAQAVRTGSAGTATTLATGASVTALLTGSDVPSGNATSCPTYPAALVTPPGSTRSVRVDLTAGGAGSGFPGCATPQIRAVSPAQSAG